MRKIRPPSSPEGRFRHVLSVGIGGSALGPQFVAEALAPDNPPLKIRFIDNTDPAGIDHQIAQLGPELASTLVIVISKSGGTPETRNGLLEVQKAFREAGLDFSKQGVAITQENSLLDNTARIEGWLARFPMFDWVGGRTSEMSAVGLLPAALQGIDIKEMLAGASLMDEANRTTVVRNNPAALLALCWYWASDGVGSKDMVVLPYKDSLLLFSRYLQQLVMESLGKEFDLDGNRVNQGLTVYGNKGSTDQHAYIQQLREGVHNFFATFIEVLRDRPPGHDWELEPGVTCGDYLFGMLQGTRSALYSNDRESITVTVQEVTPRSVGALVALYERAVGIYASLININAYHQPGVEAGKKAAGEVLALQKRVLAVLNEATTTILALSVVEGNTDPSDVQALQVMYTSLNNPSQLSNWKTSGGDPCEESWKGITCRGSAVVSIQISGLGLNGTVGYLLSNLMSLRTLDMSDNTIQDSIPYQLPPNLTTLNLASNNLSGSLPYSISSMVSLSYLNMSCNSLSESIGDIFASLTGLASLDLSFNNFSGDIPGSFSTLTNLSILHVQNNQLNGSLSVLAGLPLTDLNVANNRFSGWIPIELSSIPNFIYDGNSFDNGPAPPPPPYTSSSPGRPHNNRSHSRPGAHTLQGSAGQSSNPDNGNKKKGLTTGPIIGMTVGFSLVVLFAMLVLVFCLGKGKKKERTAARTSARSLPVSTEMQDQRMKSTATVADLRPLPAEKLIVDRLQGKNGSVRRVKSPITATSYAVASLQTATNSFSQENLIGEGSVGRVYRGEFPNGKIVAIKKIDNAALSLQEEDNFLEAVSNMSRLRHPNIITLVGYCAEHGQRLLVYDYIGNKSLHDMLHFADERSKMLTWNARVRVALGTARALEYLHEVCLPSVVHRNFKSANILLDEELNPHLSDCGLAALTPNTERQVSSTQMVGSFGYSAPEFTLSGIYTVKSDVYSFGVVMLELLTGRKPLDSSRVRSEQSLVRWATPQLHDIDALAKMVDPALNGMYPAKSLSRFADIIALCVQPEPEFRPPMSEVVQALVRLMQRASVVKRRPSDESCFTYRTSDHEATDISY